MSRMSGMGRIVAILALAACEDLTITHLEFTTWGGSHIGLSITVSGGTVEYDCAEGEILEPIRVRRRAVQRPGIALSRHRGTGRRGSRASAAGALRREREG
jgi:hypothetical protein